MLKPSGANKRGRVYARAAAPALVPALAVFLVLSCNDLRFGKKSTIHEDIAASSQADLPAPCKEDDDCPQRLRCCGGRCFECCTDGHCTAESACSQSICDGGECLKEPPLQWPLKGAVIEPPGALSLFTQEDELLAAAANHSVWMFDLAFDPPSVYTTIFFDHRITGLLMKDGLLYARTHSDVDGKDRLHIVSVTNPANPQKLPVLRSDTIDAFDVDGLLLWAVSRSVLYLISLASPTNPEVIDYMSMPCGVEALSAQDGAALVACGGSGLFEIDARDPKRPELKKLDVPGLKHAKKAVGAGGLWALLGGFEDSGGEKTMLVVLRRAEESGKLERAHEHDAARVRDVQFDGETILFEHEGGEFSTLGVDGRQVPSVAGSALSAALSDGCVISRLANADLSIGCKGRGKPLNIPAGSCRTLADADFRGSRGVAVCAEGGIFTLNTQVPAFPAAVSYDAVGEGIAGTFLMDGALVVAGTGSHLFVFTTYSEKPEGPVTLDYGKACGSDLVDAAYSGHGSMAVVVDSGGVLRILRIPTDGSELECTEGMDLAAAPIALKVDEESDTAFVLEQEKEQERLEIIDISDPSGPGTVTVLKDIEIDAFEGEGNSVLTADGDIGGRGIRHLSHGPDGLKNNEVWSGAGVTDLLIDGDRLLAGRKNGILVFGRHEGKDEYGLVHEIAISGGSPRKLVKGGDVLWVLGKDGMEGLRLSYPRTGFADIGGFEHSGKIDEALLPGIEAWDHAIKSAASLLFNKDRRFIVRASAGGELFAYEEDKGNLKLVKTFSGPDRIDGIKGAGDNRVLAWSADGLIGLFAFSGPPGDGTKVIPVTLETGAGVRDAAADKKSVCLVLDTGELGVVDTSKKTGTVVKVEGIRTGDAASIEAGKLRCWGIDAVGGVFGVNIIDPASPVLETYLPMPMLGEIQRVRLAGDRLFAASGDRLYVIDATAPDRLELSGAEAITPCEVKGIFAVENAVVIHGELDGDTVLQVVDVSDPQEPEYAGSYAMATPADIIEPVGGRLLVAAAEGDLDPPRWLDLLCPETDKDEDEDLEKGSGE
ncbi:MAG: hypothetical protein ABIJ56_20520 [Pseudomonadota bacterium]